MELCRSFDDISFDEDTQFFIKLSYLAGIYNTITISDFDFNRLSKSEPLWRNLMDENVDRTLRQTGLRATLRNARIFVSQDVEPGNYIGKNI